MDVLIQVPLVDLRGLVTPNAGRRRRPTWPNGLVGTKPGTGEFLAGFGTLQRTPATYANGWAGRAQFVPSGKALKLPDGFGGYYAGFIEAAGHELPRRSYHAQALSRCFFGSAVSPRSFAEIRIMIRDAPNAESWSIIDTVAVRSAFLPLRVPGAQRPRPLPDVGPALASYVVANTTSKSFRDPVPRWLVSPGAPLVIVATAHRRYDSPPQHYQRPVMSTAPALEAFHRTVQGAEVWVVDEPDVQRRRRVQLQLARLHTERTTLQILARAFARGAGGDSEAYRLDPANPAVQSAIRDAARYLNRTSAYGEDQAALQQVLETELVFHAGEWDAVREAFSVLPEGVTRMAQPALGTIVNERWEIIMGDKFENISGSTIVNRSQVINSFNSMTDDEDAEVKAALREIAFAVEGTGDTDAADLTTELIEAVAQKKNQSIIRSLWQSLKEAAPVVSSLTGAAGVISQLAGL